MHSNSKGTTQHDHVYMYTKTQLEFLSVKLHKWRLISSFVTYVPHYLLRAE